MPVFSWSTLPKVALARLIIDCQLPIAAAPTRQDKATLVDALDRYCTQLRNGGGTSAAQVLENRGRALLPKMTKPKRVYQDQTDCVDGHTVTLRERPSKFREGATVWDVHFNGVLIVGGTNQWQGRTRYEKLITALKAKQ